MTLTPESSPILTQPDFALAYDSAGNVGTITHTVVGGSSLATFAYDVNGNRNMTGYTVGTGGTLTASPNAWL